MPDEQMQRLTERVDQIERDLNDLNIKINSSEANLREQVKRLADALEGGLGFSGIIAKQAEQAKEIEKLKAWQRDQKVFIAGAGAVITAMLTGITFALNWLLRH